MRHLIHHLVGTATGSKASSSPIGKLFGSFFFFLQSDLSNDQSCRYDMYHAISVGCTKTLHTRRRGKMLRTFKVSNNCKTNSTIIRINNKPANLKILVEFRVKT